MDKKKQIKRPRKCRGVSLIEHVDWQAQHVRRTIACVDRFEIDSRAF